MPMSQRNHGKEGEMACLHLLLLFLENLKLQQRQYLSTVISDVLDWKTVLLDHSIPGASPEPGKTLPWVLLGVTWVLTVLPKTGFSENKRPERHT